MKPVLYVVMRVQLEKSLNFRYISRISQRMDEYCIIILITSYSVPIRYAKSFLFDTDDYRSINIAGKEKYVCARCCELIWRSLQHNCKQF